MEIMLVHLFIKLCPLWNNAVEEANRGIRVGIVRGSDPVIMVMYQDYNGIYANMNI